MAKKFILALAAAVSFAAQAGAFDFDGKAGDVNFKDSLPAVELPAVRPVPVLEPKAAGCRPFLISLEVGGASEVVVMERACTPENEAVWALTVENVRNREIAAKVVSEKYPGQRALIEKRIKAMVLDGMTAADADIVVGKVGPLLKQAAAAKTPEERKALIAAAVETLKNHLARP